MENAELLVNIQERLNRAESAIKVLIRALNTLNYENMPQEQEIKEQAIGRMNFLAMRSMEERVAELQFAELEAKMIDCDSRQKVLIADYPHLSAAKKQLPHPIYGDNT